MKRILLYLIILIVIYDISNIDNYYNYLYYNYNNYLYDYYNHINSYYNIYTMSNESKSEVLNCLYISRYMGQDWNKKFFYFDNYNNLTNYCKHLIEYIKIELNTKHNTIDSNITKYNYYQYINELILHARECIDLTGSGDQDKCIYIENLIEQQIDIKKNMCLSNVDNILCNQVKIENETPLIRGYIDKNMINFGRDYYSKNRNYHIQNLPKLENINNIENKNDALIISVVFVVGLGIFLYKIYN